MLRDLKKHLPEPFYITITADRKQFKFKVQCILQALGVEHYELTYQSRRFVFETNRPVIERRGLKTFPYTWKLIEGTISHKSYEEELVKEIEGHLRSSYFFYIFSFHKA